MSDKTIKLGLLVYCITVMALCIGGLTKYIPVGYISFFNMLPGLGIIIYWLKKWLHYQHPIELREIIFGCGVCLCLAVSIYFMAKTRVGSWLVIIQYIIAALQLAAALFFLGFIVLFKMKKLW